MEFNVIFENFQGQNPIVDKDYTPLPIGLPIPALTLKPLASPHTLVSLFLKHRVCFIKLHAVSSIYSTVKLLITAAHTFVMCKYKLRTYLLIIKHGISMRRN